MSKHRFVIDGQDFEVEVLARDVERGEASVSVNGKRHQVSVKTERSPVASAVVKSARTTSPAKGAAVAARASAAVAGDVRSPMAGRVLHVLVATGQEVTTGQSLLVLDAMKMENTISAPHAGVVAEVAALAGSTVMHGALLVRLRA